MLPNKSLSYVPSSQGLMRNPIQDGGEGKQMKTMGEDCPQRKREEKKTEEKLKIITF